MATKQKILIVPYYTGMNAVKLTIKGGRILHSN